MLKTEKGMTKRNVTLKKKELTIKVIENETIMTDQTGISASVAEMMTGRAPVSVVIGTVTDAGLVNTCAQLCGMVYTCVLCVICTCILIYIYIYIYIYIVFNFTCTCVVFYVFNASPILVLEVFFYNYRSVFSSLT